MQDDFNINEVASNVISSQLENILESISKKGGNITEKIRFTWNKKFKLYEELMKNKYSKSRSFFYRDNSVDLYTFYVPAGVGNGTSQIEEVKNLNIFTHGKSIIIQGSGGCGKSVLLRHIFLETLKFSTKIPAFVELRGVNSGTVDLTDLIIESLNSGGLDIDREIFRLCLKSGSFALFFDGFDELNLETRACIEAEIKSINDCGDNYLVLTSRPDPVFLSWGDFISYTINPLTLNNALALIRLSPVDREMNEKFAKDLKESLYDKHVSFLSNPLLLSIMLVTYRDSADIPSKLSVFYSQAYSALYQQHDAWKGGYKREKKTNLDISDFSRLLSAFSIITHNKRQFTFGHVEAVLFTKNASKITNLDVIPEHFLMDSMQAICILVDEGLSISFTHRSFQEYFSAKFIADAAPEQKIRLLDRIKENSNTDSVMKFLHEMQPDFVEIYYVLPELESIFSRIGMLNKSVTKKILFTYLNMMYGKFTINGDAVLASQNPNVRDHDTVSFVFDNLRHLSKSSVNFGKKIGENKLRDELNSLKESGSSLKVSSMGPRHSVVNILFEDGAFFGCTVLNILWEVQEAIKNKKYKIELPLEELFI